MNEDLKIGLCLSGGGYRAAAFNLGVLTYLHKVILQDGSRLLSKVVALSSVSGGTISAARYATGVARGESMETIYHSLYDFMSGTDIVALGLQRLENGNDWKKNRIRSLITAFADVYDEKLFHHAVFGELFSRESPHLEHISFNASEFTTALQFRFQWSSKIPDPAPREPERGVIGNFYHQVPEPLARSIRMGDILAASSCFPGGFEPINFPGDFILADAEESAQTFSEKQGTIALMDGGIVDNQGIEPLLLANKRMKRQANALGKGPTVSPHALDLLIVSDVSSPYMESYSSSTQKEANWLSKQTLLSLFISDLAIFGLSLGGLVLSLHFTMPFLIIVSTVFLVLSSLVLAAFLGGRAIIRRFEILKPFQKPLRRILKLQLSVVSCMIYNRLMSVMKMTGEVYLKHIRRLNYAKVFCDDSWAHRRIMNAIYELRPGERKLQEKIDRHTLPLHMIPMGRIRCIAKQASAMPTTLWFTRQQLECDMNDKSMLDKLIACGQFTICWNLLEYIEKITKDPINTGRPHEILKACREQMADDWKQFNRDPYWMINLLRY